MLHRHWLGTTNAANLHCKKCTQILLSTELLERSNWTNHWPMKKTKNSMGYQSINALGSTVTYIPPRRVTQMLQFISNSLWNSQSTSFPDRLNFYLASKKWLVKGNLVYCRWIWERNSYNSGTLNARNMIFLPLCSTGSFACSAGDACLTGQLPAWEKWELNLTKTCLWLASRTLNQFPLKLGNQNIQLFLFLSMSMFLESDQFTYEQSRFKTRASSYIISMMTKPHQL